MIAREKCTILKPRPIESVQIPIIAIAVQKRIFARIAINGSCRSAFNLLILERNSRTLGLSHTRS